MWLENCFVFCQFGTRGLEGIFTVNGHCTFVRARQNASKIESIDLVTAKLDRASNQWRAHDPFRSAIPRRYETSKDLSGFSSIGEHGVGYAAEFFRPLGCAGRSAPAYFRGLSRVERLAH